MARKSVYSVENIVDAAFRVVRRHGVGKLTARGVAEQLKASTAPVYSNFANMDDLQTAVLAKANDLLFEYMTESRTENVFMNMGLGVLYFARENPNLYRGLFLDCSCKNEHSQQLKDALLEILREDPLYEPLSAQQRESLLVKMGVFTQGLATRISVSPEDDLCIDELRRLLEEVGQVLVRDAFERTRAEKNENDGETGCES